MPIVLATYPLSRRRAGRESKIFSSCFLWSRFSSVLVQGATIPAVSRLLGVAAPFEKPFRYSHRIQPDDESGE